MKWRDCIDARHAVGSTMEEARGVAARGAPEGSTVCARAQTAGRGRHGRRWISALDAGVWLTTVLRPPAQPGVEHLSLVAGVAVWRAMRALGAHDVRLKWPNDLVARGRKLAGLLLEADGLGTEHPKVFVGIGINWAASATVDWPAELQGQGIGLQDLVPAAPTPKAVAEAVVESLQTHYAAWKTDGLQPTLAAWREADALAKQTVRVAVNGDWLQGEADGVADDGQLIVQTAAGAVHVGAGEVLCVRPNMGDSYV
jgi:BirA family transcriptional regulator, biotin operon repressor / biotin---[acetyl-CoA-carboxylase] ligase